MLKAWSCAAILGLLLCPSAQAADGWEGTWRDTQLDGIGASPAENCEVIALGDRTILLAKAGDGYEGQWLAAFQRRATRAIRRDGRCQLSNSKNPLFALRMHRWSITGRLDPASGRMKVVGHSGDCTGDGCESDWKAKNGTFQTVLELRGGRLVDLGIDSASPTERSFMPDASYRAGAAAVASEMKRLAELTAKGGCGAFYDAAASTFRNSVARPEFITLCDGLAGQVRSRSYVDQLYVPTLGKGDWPYSGPYVIFMNRVNASAGTGVEFAVFAKEGGVMRVMYWTLAF